MTDTNNWLMGSGAKSFTFSKVGDTARGEIVSLDLQQQRDFATNEPKTWPDGNPMMQMKVVIHADIYETTDDDDDGNRAIYIKGDMQRAVREAVQAAGAKGLEPGGTLAVKYDSDGTPAKKGWNPPKQFKAQYELPPVVAEESAPADEEPF